MNKLKNTVNKAGFYTARFPIAEHFNYTKDKQNILSPEEMFGILAMYNEKGCWREAVEESVDHCKGLEWKGYCNSSCKLHY